MERRRFRFENVDAELADRLKRAFRLTLKKNLARFNEDTRKYGYRPDRITTLEK